MAPSKWSKQELTRARVARDAALNSIRKIHALALEANMDEHKRPIFIARHGTVERVVKSFEAEQGNILSSLVELNRSEEFTNLDLEITENMEEMCGEIQVVFSKIRGCPSTTQQGAIVERENTYNSRASLSLPKIELPKFDGSLINWCAFRDMFTSLVHENRSITDIERFHYLVSC